MADRDNDNLRKFVWVARKDRGLQRRIRGVARRDDKLRVLGRLISPRQWYGERNVAPT
jgi:hypothetical protein